MKLHQTLAIFSLAKGVWHFEGNGKSPAIWLWHFERRKSAIFQVAVAFQANTFWVS